MDCEAYRNVRVKRANDTKCLSCSNLGARKAVFSDLPEKIDRNELEFLLLLREKITAFVVILAIGQFNIPDRVFEPAF